MKWDVVYRKRGDGEIRAVVEAETREEAVQKLLAGDVETVKVSYWTLRSDLVEARPKED